MTNLKGLAWKDRNFWLIEVSIAGKPCLTQARNLQEIQSMADDLALCYGVEDPHVQINFRDPVFQETVDRYFSAREKSKAAQTELGLASRQAVSLLRSQGASVREVAAVLGLSPSRVSQLAN